MAELSWQKADTGIKKPWEVSVLKYIDQIRPENLSADHVLQEVLDGY